MLKIKQKIKSWLRSLTFYIKARPRLFKIGVSILKYFPKLDNKLRVILSNDPVESPFKKADVITKVDDDTRLKALYAMKYEIEMIKQRKL